MSDNTEGDLFKCVLDELAKSRPNAKIGQAEETVAAIETLHKIGYLENAEIAKIFVEGGPALLKGLQQLFDLAHVSEDEPDPLLNVKHLGSKETGQGQSLESILQYGLSAKAADEIPGSRILADNPCKAGCSSQAQRTYAYERDGGKEYETYCDGCDMTLKAVFIPAQSCQLSAKDKAAMADVDRRLAVIQRVLEEREQNEPFVWPIEEGGSLSGKSLEAVLNEGTSLEDVLGEGTSIEEILGEVDA